MVISIKFSIYNKLVDYFVSGFEAQPQIKDN